MFDTSFERYLCPQNFGKNSFFNYSHPYVQGATQFENNETLKSMSISSHAYRTLEECVIFQTYLNRTLQGNMGKGNYFEKSWKVEQLQKAINPNLFHPVHHISLAYKIHIFYVVWSAIFLTFSKWQKKNEILDAFHACAIDSDHTNLFKNCNSSVPHLRTKWNRFWF